MPVHNRRSVTGCVALVVVIVLVFFTVLLTCHYSTVRRVSVWRRFWSHVIFTLSTVPWRVSTLPKVVDNLFAAVPDATVVLNIPFKLKRKQEAYPPLPAALIHHPKAAQIVVQRVEDVGPMTKSLPTFRMHNTLRTKFGSDAVVVIVDDDILYKPEPMHSLLSFWTHLGADGASTVVSNSNAVFMQWKPPFAIVEGFAGIVVPLAVCTDELVATLASVVEQPASEGGKAGCLTCDDMVLSWALRRHNIQAQQNHWIRNPLTWVGNSEIYDGDQGALKQQGHADAYARCLVGLQAMT